MSEQIPAVELKSIAAETLLDADELLRIIGDDDALKYYADVIRWLKPQAQEALNAMRKGKVLTLRSREMMPVLALQMVEDDLNAYFAELAAEVDPAELESAMRELGM